MTMWRRKAQEIELPAIEVNAATPLRANFDDSDSRKDESSIHTVSDVASEKGVANVPVQTKLQILRTLFHHNSKLYTVQVDLAID
jgi:hypothetical protein